MPVYVMPSEVFVVSSVITITGNSNVHIIQKRIPIIQKLERPGRSSLFYHKTAFFFTCHIWKYNHTGPIFQQNANMRLIKGKHDFIFMGNRSKIICLLCIIS
jgi:hypothetical protein